MVVGSPHCAPVQCTVVCMNEIDPFYKMGQFRLYIVYICDHEGGGG